MNILEIALRIAHIAPAVVLGGALVFRLVAVQPVLQGLDEAQRRTVGAALARRWIGMLWVCVGLLALSGLLNFLLFKLPAYRGKPFAGLYHGLFGIKLLAALALFHAGAVLTMPGEHFERYRARAGFWLAYATVLLALILVVAALLRYLPGLYA